MLELISNKKARSGDPLKSADVSAQTTVLLVKVGVCVVFQPDSKKARTFLRLSPVSGD